MARLPADPYRPTFASNARGRFDYYLTRLALRIARIAERRPVDKAWYHACYTIALVSADRSGVAEALSLLSSVFDRPVGTGGDLVAPIAQPWQVMGGYALCYASERCVGGRRYLPALENLFGTIQQATKATNGGILYTPDSHEIFVDTVGMICPFIAAFARITGSEVALRVCSDHLEEFFQRNIDPETHLPFHAYYFPSPSKLGLHGWGRGVGWYILGLADVANELTDGPLKDEVITEIRRISVSLRNYQKPNGNWGVQIPVRSSEDDLSATAFCAYGIARAMRQKILDRSMLPVLTKALSAIAEQTDHRGRVANSSAEAYGVGRYGYTFGPQPWCDGMAAAAVLESVAVLAGLD